MADEQGGPSAGGEGKGGNGKEKGEVVIQQVARDLNQVARRYILLVLSPSAEPLPPEDLAHALGEATEILSLAEKDNGGEEEGTLKFQCRAQPDQFCLVDRHDFADCPWFSGDAPEGSWASVYEVIADVSLRHKLADPRFVFLKQSALALARALQGRVFDIQEWRTIE